MPKGVYSGVPFISSKDVTELGQLSFKNIKMISEDDYIKLSRKVKPKIGDIIYTRIGSVGRAALVNESHPDKFLISYSSSST